MDITVGKIAALLIAAGYALALIIHAGGVTAQVVWGCACLLLPLALIWFPEEAASTTRYFRLGRDVHTVTPPVLVSLLGWAFLVGAPVLAYLAR